MIKRQITLTETVDLLNSLLKIDRRGISELFQIRVKCNEELANHPTVQIGDDKKGYYVGLLGILNGLFGIAEDGYGAIEMKLDDDNLITEFKIIRNQEDINDLHFIEKPRSEFIYIKAINNLIDQYDNIRLIKNHCYKLIYEFDDKYQIIDETDKKNKLR